MKVTAFLFAAAASVAHAQGDFVTACSGKSAGTDCVYSLPDGTQLSGTCFSPQAASACGPDYTAADKCVMCGESDPTSGSEGGDSSPAKENASVAACDNKDEGDSCAFTSPDGNKMTGLCEDQGAGACGPDADTSSTCYVCNSSPTDGGDSSGPDNSTNECTGKRVGESCEVTHEGTLTDGVCSETSEDLETGDGHLSCSPITATDPPSVDENTDGPVSDVLAVACANKSEGATCTYVDFNNQQQSGSCVMDNDALQCDSEVVVTEATADDSPLVAACADKAVDASCTAEFPELTLEGSCQENESGSTLICSVLRALRGRR